MSPPPGRRPPSSGPIPSPFTPHLGYSFILRQVPMGHEETIVLILILSHLIVVILKKRKKYVHVWKQHVSRKILTCEHLRKKEPPTASSLIAVHTLRISQNPITQPPNRAPVGVGVRQDTDKHGPDVKQREWWAPR